VFGIGFHKAGTKSLANALRELDYRVTGPDGVNDPRIARTHLRMCRRLAEQFDAFQDNPWPLVYREMDRRYPQSKFILTVRDTEEWWRSVVGHFGAVSTPMREWIYGYGSPIGHQQRYVARYEQHNREVLEYFEDRPQDLLVLRITDGEGWERLAPFLGVSAPSTEFPHANAADGRSSRP